ncbi:acyltransferase family protein [Parahaliea mediterranea]|uniref:acyltransferase family protein n=1 Tax=Parahaliea mediterranea TaxID=651086 RepID=UPI000E2E8627|nr:acyltransferase [Parahaliea mediterranea]
MFGTYRTFLALLVVATHLGGYPGIGSYAVFGFYCLSGYLMTLIMQRRYGYSSDGVLRYGLNRFLRIFPVYWVSIGLSLALIALLGSEFTASYHHAIYRPEGVAQWARNLLLYFPQMEDPRLTPPAWALTVELFFYALIALGASRSLFTSGCWLAVSVLHHVIVEVLQMESDHWYFSIPAASLPFATGALIFHYSAAITRFTGRFSRSGMAWVLAGVGAGILLNWLLGQVVGGSAKAHFYINFLLCAAMVALLFDRRELPLISRAADKWLGDFSYPIYLLHYQVGLVVVVLGGYAGMTLERPGNALMIFATPLILATSWGVTVLLERPIERLRSRIKA